MGRLLETSAFQPQDSLFAWTFHLFVAVFCVVMAITLAFLPNFVIYDSDDQEGLVKLILKDLDLSPKEFKPSSLMYFVENAKNNFQTPDQLGDQLNGYWQEFALKVYREYQKRLSQFQALDFNDLLFKTVELFYQHPDVLHTYQRHYPFVLVDEYQDTNQIQYLLTKLIAAQDRQITAVGDASQSIYGWRGADYRNLTAFTTDFVDAKVINLEQNYRSTQIILDAANAVISKNTSHPILKLFTKKNLPIGLNFMKPDLKLTRLNMWLKKSTFFTKTSTLITATWLSSIG